MWLKQTYILSVEMMAQNFCMNELWNNAQNGTLYTFEKEAEDTDQYLRIEILNTLENMWDGKKPEFMGKGLDLNKMQGYLEKFSSGSRSVQDRKDFFSRNWDQIENIAFPLQENCTFEQAWQLYLLLLLQLQARPKYVLQEKDLLFLRDCFGKKEKKQVSVLDQTEENGKVCMVHGTLLYAQGECIFALKCGKWELLYQGEKEIQDFTFCESYGLIICLDDGSLPVQIHPEIKKLAQGYKMKKVSSFGSQFALLTQDGKVLTNLRISEEEKIWYSQWKHVTWMRVGLNSLSGFCGNLKSGIQIGSDKRIEDFTDIKMTDTRTDEACHFMILRENGMLYSEQGRIAEEVCVGCLTKDGCWYMQKDRTKEGKVAGWKMVFLPYGLQNEKGEIWKRFSIQTEIKELYAREQRVVCRVYEETGECLYLQQSLRGEFVRVELPKIK